MYKRSELEGQEANTKTRRALEYGSSIRLAEQLVKQAILDPNLEISGALLDAWLEVPGSRRGAELSQWMNRPSKLRLTINSVPTTSR